MSVKIAGIHFEHHDYDERGDVLYLTAAGREGSPKRACATPEGHGIEYDRAGKVTALTLVNARWLLDRDGELTITWPAERVQAADLADALLSSA